jgi:hypothetical protein
MIYIYLAFISNDTETNDETSMMTVLYDNFYCTQFTRNILNICDLTNIDLCKLRII